MFGLTKDLAAHPHIAQVERCPPHVAALAMVPSSSTRHDRPTVLAPLTSPPVSPQICMVKALMKAHSELIYDPHTICQ